MHTPKTRKECYHESDTETIAHIPCTGKILQSEINAAHIVRCVNTHDALVDALQEMLEFLEDIPQPSIQTYLSQMTTKARAALTLAKG